MPDREATVPVPARADFLTIRHGILNVTHVLTAHALLVAWFVLACPVLPLALYMPASLIACVIHQRTMSEWIHEGSHHNFVRGVRRNDRLIDALVSMWFGVTVSSYRSSHFAHHETDAFFRAGDPDTDFLDVASRREFWRAVVRDLTGRAIVRQFQRFESNATEGRTVAAMLAIVGLQLGLLAVLLRAGRLDAYILYYGSLCTLYPLLNRLRVYGQHAGLGDRADVGIAASDVSRTIDGGLLDRILWTSPRLLYHHEHHVFPSLPYRALASLCERSVDRNVYAERRWAVLRDVYASLPSS